MKSAPTILLRSGLRLLLLVIFITCLAVGWASASEPDADPETPPAVEGAELPAVGLGSEPDPLADDDFDFDFEDDFDFEFDDIESGFPDPFETPNRGILVVNQTLDTFILDPVTRVYRFVFPEPVRRCFYRMLDNINSPQALVNDLFQLEWKDAGNVTARLLINSTVGVGGIFDPARKWGLEPHKSDFGQTLAIAGAPSGPYFVLPVLGPTTVRSGIGLGVDAFFHPTFFLLGGVDVIIFTGSAGMTERARHFEELQALNESSIDFYAALRSGYYQNRVSEIWSRREHRRSDAERRRTDPFAE